MGWSRPYPFLRLLVPLAVGIAVGDRFPCEVPLWLWMLAGLIPLALYGIYGRYVARRCICSAAPFSSRWENGNITFPISASPTADGRLFPLHTAYRCLFGSAVFLFLFLTGFASAGRQWRMGAFPYHAGQTAAYRVRLVEKPQEKERSLLFRALLWGKGGEAEALPRTSPKPCLLYFPKDSSARALRRGDELFIYARLSPPHDSPLPGTFDYARYLRRKGISATAYVPPGMWQVAAHDDRRGLRQLAADLRERVVASYRRMGFEGDELGVLSALTVGYRETLDRELADAYATAGAAHVLAISGLHTGFLYALFLFLFAPLWRRWRWLKLPLVAVILLLLWGFALFTGLSTSVVRAAVMCSLSLLSLLQYHKPFTLNLLAAAAFGMLLLRPLWLFDAGFQLSFAAVAGIVWLQPKLAALWRPRPLPLIWLWSLVTLSIAAEAATLPLTLHYFSRFPTYFLGTNLWVIPMVTLVLYGGVLLWVSAPFPPLVHPLAALLRGLIQWQNSGLSRIAALPYASIEGIHWRVVDVLLCYLALFLVVRWLRHRSAANLMHALALLLLFFSCLTFAGLQHAPRPTLLFYHVRGTPAVHCLGKGSRSWLVSTDTPDADAKLRRQLSGYWNTLRLEPPTPLAEGMQNADISLRQHILTYGGKRICLLADNHWRGLHTARPLRLDYLYILSGYTGSLAELAPLFTIGTVVLDASLPQSRQESFVAECHALAIPYRQLAEEGILRFPL